LKTDVQITVTGIIARTTLRQEFVNPSRVKDDWAEGIYVFPCRRLPRSTTSA